MSCNVEILITTCKPPKMDAVEFWFEHDNLSAAFTVKCYAERGIAMTSRPSVCNDEVLGA